MKLLTPLIAVASFAAGALAAKPSLYSNAVYGFTIAPPAFAKGEKDSSVQTAMFFAPVRNGFAGNLGVTVQFVTMTVDEYVALSTGQFKQAGLKVISETRKKVSGRDAVLWEYQGALQGRELRWIALAVVDADRIFLITGTSTQADYGDLEKDFKAGLDSFKIEE